MSDEQTELLRQILAMQQEQLAFAKQNAANFRNVSFWRMNAKRG